MSNSTIEVLIRAKDEATKKVKEFSNSVAEAGKQAANAAKLVALAGTAALVAFGVDSVKAAQEAEQADRQLAAVLKSTGEAAGITKEEVLNLASALQSQTTIGDEAIVSAQSMLLTFTNIGKDVFPKATETVLDMATAMNNGATPSAEQLSGSAIQLGKALNDPTKGISALTKVGVTFTDSQKKMIEQMQKAGDVAGAQRLILDELAKEFGGSAAAQTETFTGKMQQLRNKIGDVQEVIGAELIKVLSQLIDIMAPVIERTVKWAAEALPGAVARISEWIAKGVELVTHLFEFGKKMSENQAIMAAFSAALTTLMVPSLFSTASAAVKLVASLTPISVTLLAISGVTYALYQAWVTNFGGIQQEVEAILPVIQGVFDSIVRTVSLWAQQFKEYFEDAFASVRLWLDWFGMYWPDVYQTFVDGTKQLFDQVVSLILPFVETAKSTIEKFFQNVMDFVNYFDINWAQVWESVKQAALTVFNFFVDEVVPTAQRFFELVTAVFTRTTEVIMYTLAGLKAAWDTNFLGMRSIFQTVFDLLVIIFNTAWEVLKKAIDTALALFKGDWQKAWDGITGIFSSILGGLKDIADRLVKPIIETIMAIPKAVADALNSIKSLPGAATGSVQDELRGIIEKQKNYSYPKVPKQAKGGPVGSNMPYIVGEIGPELFVPSSAGRIIPNNQLAGSGGQSINIDMRGSTFLSENVANKITDMVVNRLKRITKIPSRSL